ncbi:MAG TPA: glutamate-5-semialdehyde dehydrogenase [Polyangia bacterium]|nr:glutamate-5-semialdehyde dehydrogenase [Polyangia bacterium]
MIGEVTEIDIAKLARDAKAAGRLVAKAGAERRTAALHAIAAAVDHERAAILAANADDIAAAEKNGLSPPMIDRLRLDDARIGKIAAALRDVAALPDPVGQAVKEWTRPNGLKIARRRIPLGVIAIIYESRPNVTTDAAAVCLRAGNATILRGGSEAFRSNRALMTAVAAGLAAAGLPPTAVQLVPTTDRAAMAELLTRDEEIDLVIPRGGEQLIRFVAERSRIPVIKHYRGNCHVFVERTADEGMALEICYNSKVQRPGVCNAAETILIDEAIAHSFLPQLAERLGRAGVELRGDERARTVVPTLKPATDEDFAAEFLDLVCAVGVVSGLGAAVRHIERFGSSHTESIVTRDPEAARRFTEDVDSSCVMVNASTRFADGGELGLGAEIGISTTRLHAYGPMGAEELTTTKFVVIGEGHTR